VQTGFQHLKIGESGTADPPQRVAVGAGVIPAEAQSDGGIEPSIRHNATRCIAEVAVRITKRATAHAQSVLEFLLTFGNVPADDIVRRGSQSQVPGSMRSKLESLAGHLVDLLPVHQPQPIRTQMTIARSDVPAARAPDIRGDRIDRRRETELLQNGKRDVVDALKSVVERQNNRLRRDRPAAV